MLEMHVTSKCVPAKSEVASDTFAETCDSMAGMTWATHHYLVAATNYWTKLVAATNTSGQICDLLPPMTEMDIESTACGRNEIGPQDRYFLPDPGFTPGHDRDAYRVTQVRAPIFLSRNEDFQLFSTFFRFFHPSPKTEVERGGKRWNANAKRVETGETDSTLFHLFPPVSTCFHLKIISGRDFTLTVAAEGLRSLSQHIAAYRNVFFSEPVGGHEETQKRIQKVRAAASAPTRHRTSSLFQGIPAYSNVFIFADTNFTNEHELPLGRWQAEAP